MKQGCEIKKLGEVATYVNGYAFKPDHWTDDGVPIIRIQNLNNQDAVYNYCNMDIPKKFVVEYGDILISWSASLGVYEWLGERSYLNQHIFKVVFDKCNINKYFFKYAVSSKINEMLKNAHGATMKHIVKKDFDNTEIIYPSIAEQERIVGELDCLSGIIAAKRAQLRELDTLAQSIFYTMFGDPITNDKGWQTKALGNVCVVNPPKKDTLADVQSDDFVSFIPMEDLSVKAGYVKSKQQRLCKDVQSSYTCFADNDILMAKVTPCFENGKVGITQNLVNGIGFGSSEFIVIRPVNVIKEYVYFVIQTPIFIDEAVKRLTGTSGLRRVPRTYVEECIISIPPIDLQKQFAEKIENIERQKELITKSIKETEDLFNSRMDYYFN